MPISGVIKSTFPVMVFNGLDFWGKILTISTLLYFVSLITFLKNSYQRRLKFAFSISALLHIFYNFTFQSGIGQWYWVSQYLCIALFLTDIAENFSRKLNFVKFSDTIISYVLTIILILPCLLLSSLKLIYNFSLEKLISNKFCGLKIQKEDFVKKLARKLDSALKPGTPVFVYDTAGRLAFYSELKIVPSDGLVNNFDYFHQIETMGFQDF